VMKEVKREATRRKVKLVILPTAKADQKIAGATRRNQRDPAPHLLNRKEEKRHTSRSMGRVPRCCDARCNDTRRRACRRLGCCR
jgi:hypothetical protein